MTLVADASALLAILLDEADADYYKAVLLAARTVWISPVNWWEVLVRVRGELGEEMEAETELWRVKQRFVVEPITLEHAKLAAAAFARYRGRPARLNLGDCFAYALAQDKGVGLLYKGNDFTQTDVDRHSI